MSETPRDLDEREAGDVPADAGSSPADGPSAGGLPGGVPSWGASPGGRRPAGRRSRPRGHSPWRTAFFVLAAVAVIVGGCWALLGNRLLVVRSVSVSGTHTLTPAQVTAVADVSAGTPLLRVNAGEVARRVESIRQVASASVTKNWPDGLQITVTERVPAMAVRMAAGGYDLIDKTGVIVRWSGSRPAALPLLVTAVPGSALSGSASVTTSATVLAELAPPVARQVTKVQPEPAGAGGEQVTLSLSDGTTVQWGDPGNAGQKNRELSVLLPGGARDIDVSAPGTAVTR